MMSNFQKTTQLPALPQKQSGLSLIEIMIAVTLGLILMAGLIQFFVGSKQTFQVLDSINGMQENGRYALRVITDSLHAADHWGGVESSDVSGSAAVTGIGGCDSTWIFKISEGIRGYEGAATSPLPSGCIANTADYLPNSDAFVVRHAGGTFASGAVASTTGTDIWVRTTIAGTAAIMPGASIPAADTNGVYNYPYDLEAYFIRPCSVRAGTACAATDDGGKPIPTLVRLALDGNVLKEQALVSGVEQMQIEYGVDSNADTNADFYATATAIDTANQWSKVASVRISLVMRSDQRGKIADTTTYTLPGGYSHTPTTADRNYTRKVFTRLIQIRNRSRS